MNKVQMQEIARLLDLIEEADVSFPNINLKSGIEVLDENEEERLGFLEMIDGGIWEFVPKTSRKKKVD